MFRIVYTSVRNPRFDIKDFARLCGQSAHKNRRLGLTGLLLSNEAEFLQFLEGERECVIQVYKSIQLDFRHSDIRLLLSETAGARLFEGWGMMGLTMPSQLTEDKHSTIYRLIDPRFYKPWKTLGQGAVDLIFEYAKVKAELEKAGELALLREVFEVFQPG